MTPSNEFTSDNCDVASERPLSRIRSIYNEVNEVFMVDTDEANLNDVYGRNMSYNLLFNCVYKAAACVISSVYFGNQEASNELTNDKDSVDILINQRHSRVSNNSPVIPGGNVKFNYCLARIHRWTPIDSVRTAEGE